ncbi:MAG: aminomethyl-transferring glycine dehydrogenase [Planctomycetaceae bacterium]|nr:aminomethyl-transferring glycine dehydrogenase [Planctomycetaceae bacterium]
MCPLRALLGRTTPPVNAPLRPDLGPSDLFAPRHLGPSDSDVADMLKSLRLASLDALVDEAVPASIRIGRELDLGADLARPRGEHELLADLLRTASKNTVLRSLIGLGYHDCIVPPVVQRNVLENPGWYTQYTPYQAEISQGRLEALLNYQTMVTDLCGLPLSNASLLDEGTAAAEALSMCLGVSKGKGTPAFFASERCHPQTLAVVRTRAEAAGVTLHVGDAASFDFEATPVCGALVQYPDTYGRIDDLAPIAARLHGAGAKLVVATDLLALTMLRAPGEFGADVAIGSAQRFGVPMGFGGPHAAFLACAEEFKRQMPGRIIGLSKDRRGKPALRMAMQTREQHIRRDKATSNICTAQVLLSIMASFYGVYHGPAGLLRIARRVQGLTAAMAKLLEGSGHGIPSGVHFDTLRVQLVGLSAAEVHNAARAAGFNLRHIDATHVGVSLDERSTPAEVASLLGAFGLVVSATDVEASAPPADRELAAPHGRKSGYLSHPVFHRYHSEHEMLRYIKKLESRDLSLCHSMIPLGSCTMKLNGTSEMLPVTWPQFGALHPFCPPEQAEGYHELFSKLESALAEITGFAAVSLQPNAGSQGEYAGLLTIRAFHQARGQGQRDVCLIPTSAHGTNPASAVMCGMRVVGVRCDERGNVDVADLAQKASQHADRLAALMVTYPSTHGVFEESIAKLCAIVHEHGGQVYMDGANMNAQVGLCRPGDFGADVCHLNLHKTFCIPHGGGGPGMGPICVAPHLAPHLPGHPLVQNGGTLGPVSAAPWGSASILPISWVYIALMGPKGLRRASEIAILSANYMAKRLEEHFDIVYTNTKGRVAHEFILDVSPFEKSAGVSAEDIAKRLMDYGYHAPTMSWPVPGSLMIEPTESESKAELDRFCEALISIRAEIRAVEEGRWTREDNPLANAPHTADEVIGDGWNHAYSREQAAFPAPWCREHKFWPHVSRVDNGYGDKHLVCTCPPVEAYA